MRRLLVVGWLVVLGTVAGSAQETPEKLAVKLTDGSLLLGTSSVREIVIESSAVGQVTVTFNRLRAIKRVPDSGALTLTFRNGDTLQGTTKLATLPLTTVFGDVKVPVASVTHIQIGEPPVETPPFTGDPLVAARRTLNDVRQIDAAIDQWALETGQRNGAVVNLPAVATYLRGALSTSLRDGKVPKDQVGNPFLIGPVGPDQVKVHPKTKETLAGANIDWGGF